MAIKLTDEVAVRIATSGGRFEYITLSDFNTLISTEEDARLTALETTIDTPDTGLVDRVEAIENANSVTVVDLSAGTGDYAIESAGIYVFTDNKAEPASVLLPEAVAGLVGMKAVISNQDNADLDVVPNGTDTINGVKEAETLATTESITVVCYAAGKWAIV